MVSTCCKSVTMDQGMVNLVLLLVLQYIITLYVAEYRNRRISPSVFRLNGQFCSIIGSGQLSNPYDVTVNSNGHLLVANYSGNCITSFTIDGTCVGRFNNKGQVNYPMGLTTVVLT